MKIDQVQVNAIFSLPAEQRFEHFVKKFVDWQEAWGLYLDGWALAGADDGVMVFPLWPAEEYAQACAINEWQGYQPQAISLDSLLEELLPKMKKDGLLPGIIFTPDGRGATPSVDELIEAINSELGNY